MKVNDEGTYFYQDYEVQKALMVKLQKYNQEAIDSLSKMDLVSYDIAKAKMKAVDECMTSIGKLDIWEDRKKCCQKIEY